MGQQAGVHDRLFYCFNLDSHIPIYHLLRCIDRFLDLSDLRGLPLIFRTVCLGCEA